MSATRLARSSQVGAFGVCVRVLGALDVQNITSWFVWRISNRFLRGFLIRNMYEICRKHVSEAGSFNLLWKFIWGIHETYMDICAWDILSEYDIDTEKNNMQLYSGHDISEC